jgi:hypothetical protein
MEPNISFFKLLWPTNKAFPAWMVSVSADVAAHFALGRVIPWAAVCIDLESNVLS